MAREPPAGAADSEFPLPMAEGLPSPFASMSRSTPDARPEVDPHPVDRGVVVFDLDGTLLDDLRLTSAVAADVLERAFHTPADEGRVHYLATTGMPFEAQIAQLYPKAPAPLRASTARIFHQRKVTEAYAHASPFPDVPKLLKRLSQERWTLVVSTGAETEMAELILEREGLRYWFEGVLGSAEGTKREHLTEYQRRFPGARLFLVGDSRFDMEAALSVEGVTPIGRATSFLNWTLTPEDLRRWGAEWADYSLSELPEVLARLERPRRATRAAATDRRRTVPDRRPPKRVSTPRTTRSAPRRRR
ncbi:MAG: HAD family hydrolase [Thermoplasmata archaeon]